MPGWGEYLTLWQLARRRFRSGEDYRTFQTFQGSLLMAHFQSKGLSFEACQVLDIGCGWGGYSQLFARAGASVVSLDLELDDELASDVRRRLVVGDAQALPLCDGRFDFVFCASLMEHVPDPGRLAVELYRVLRVGGRCYVGFPPFYSPAGGHQFKPFHLLGERVAVALKGNDGRTYANAGGNWGLYRLGIRQAQRHLIDAGFCIDDVSTKFLPLNPARLPLLGEFLTWYVQFLARKVSA
jgi:SAM-dependent methyltransferase